jgi:hypothetical protein
LSPTISWKSTRIDRHTRTSGEFSAGSAQDQSLHRLFLW